MGKVTDWCVGGKYVLKNNSPFQNDFNKSTLPFRNSFWRNVIFGHGSIKRKENCLEKAGVSKTELSGNKVEMSHEDDNHKQLKAEQLIL